MNWAVCNINKCAVFKENFELIPKLPKKEQVIIDLVLNNSTQKEIAKIMGLTQGAVSSRIRRAQERLLYLKYLGDINFDIFFRDLEKICDPLGLEIIKGLIDTSCQSETAWKINEKFDLQDDKKMNQVKIRHRFENILELLRKIGGHSKKYQNHFRTLQTIKDNLYLLHEVKLPHFDRAPI